MKKTNILPIAGILACTMFTGITFTSCDDDDDDSKKSEITINTYSQEEAQAYVKNALKSSIDKLNNIDATSTQMKSLYDLEKYYDQNYKDYAPVNNTDITINDILSDLKSVANGDVARIDFADKILSLAGTYKADEANHQWIKTGDATDRITVVFKDQNGKEVTGQMIMILTNDELSQIAESRVYLTIKGENIDCIVGLDRNKGPYETTTRLKVSQGKVLIRTDISATKSHRNTNISLSYEGNMVATAHITENGENLNDDLAKNRKFNKRLTSITLVDKIFMLRSNSDVEKTREAKTKEYASTAERIKALSDVNNKYIKDTWFDINETFLFSGNYEPSTYKIDGKDKDYLKYILTFSDGTKKPAGEAFAIMDVLKQLETILSDMGIENIL